MPRFSSRAAAHQTKNLTHDRRILLFDLAASGHHPVYIQYLVQHWHEMRLPGTLQVVVSPQFVERHPDIVALALNTDSCRIQFIAVSTEEYTHFKQRKSLVAQSFAEWNLFCRYADRLGATQGLLMYFDSFQIPLIVSKKSPCPVSGIYFRPTFHYGEFANYKPTWKEWVRQQRQKLILTLILKKPQFDTLFCLDLFAVKQLEKLSPHSRIVPLADPVQVHQSDQLDAEKLRLELGISSDKQVFLLFGELNSRKGIHQVFEAIRLLSSEVSQRVCLLLAGSINASQRDKIEAGIAKITETTDVQLIVHDRYIKGHEVQHYFEIADVVLATYQRHVGMSSILLHAAAAEKPVIASNYGLLGELARFYELGIVIDSTNPRSIAKGIGDYLDDSSQKVANRQKMNEFASQNLASKFVETIASELMQPSKQTSIRHL